MKIETSLIIFSCPKARPLYVGHFGIEKKWQKFPEKNGKNSEISRPTACWTLQANILLFVRGEKNASGPHLEGCGGRGLF